MLSPPDSLRKMWLNLSLRSLFKNTVWLVGDKLVSLVLGLVLAVVMARHLGPDLLGTYQYALALVSMIAPLAQLGLEGIVLRDMVREPGFAHEIMGTSFSLLGGAATAAAIATTAFLFWTHAPETLLVATASMTMIFQSLNVIDFWFRSRVEARYSVMSARAATTISTVVALYLILHGASLTSLALSAALETALAAGALILFYRLRGGSLTSWSFSMSRARSLLVLSWPLLVASLAGAICLRSSFPILRSTHGDAAVGLYSSALRLAEVWTFLPMAVASSVFPALVRAIQSADHTHPRNELQALFDMVTGLAFAIAIPTSLFATQIVVLLFGDEFAPSGPILRVQIWAFVLFSQGIVRNTWLVAEGMSHHCMAMNVAGGIIYVTLAMALIPRFAGIGAAIAAIATQIAILYLLPYASPRLRPSVGPLLRSLVLPFRLRAAVASLHAATQR